VEDDGMEDGKTGRAGKEVIQQSERIRKQVDNGETPVCADTTFPE
jgi:hypothetical protein